MKKEEKSSGGDFYLGVTEPPEPKNIDTVLYLIIKPQNYNPLAEKASIIDLFHFQHCPCCKNVDGWAYHALYFKYHKNVQIVILRVRCLGCMKTHAIIPCFSVPHTSLDTPTVQCYLDQRAAGLSRQKSAQASGFTSYSLDFLRSLDKRFSTTVFQAKALYPGMGDPHLNGVAWLSSTAACKLSALEVLNTLFIKQTGQSFFGGNLIDSGRPNTLAKGFSLKITTTRSVVSVLDST